jgi:hypothetical protein
MRREKMKKILILVAALIIMVPSLATADTFTLRAGIFFPRAQGGTDSLWTIEFDQMSFRKYDMKATTLGLAYEYFLTKELSLELSVDTYSKKKYGYYRDYVGYSFDDGDFAFPASIYNGDFEVAHALDVSLTPVQFSLKLYPLGRRVKLIPYIGGGVGVYFWSVGIRGEIVDFTDEWVYEDPDLGDVPIYGIDQADIHERGRVSFGTQAFGGLMFPLGNRVTINGEFRYYFVQGKFKSDSDFMDFDNFDLNGFAVTLGFNYWF